jgi:RNA polymerase sigma factor (sigma-70 family)
MEASSLPRPRGRVALRPSRRLLAPLSDERLVDQVRRGNEAAFEVIYDRHHRGILGFCRHMLRSPEEAEDAVQHTFISAYADLAASEKPIQLKAWLYTIARNRCLSMLRARRPQTAELPEVPTAGLSDEVLARDDLRRLLADVQSLPEEQRAALVLSELGDLSHADVAQILGCEAMKVKSLVFQARSSLIEDRRASEIPCHEIREQLATVRGGALRRGPLRRHLRSCTGCSEYRDSVRRQRKMLALALPVVPTAGLKQAVLAGVGVAPGAAGGAAAGGAFAGGAATSGGAASVGGAASAGGASVVSAVGGVTGGGVLSGVGAAGAAKVALVAIVAASGGVAINQATSADHAGRESPAAVQDGATEAGGAGALPGGAVPGAGAGSAADAAKARSARAKGGGPHGKGPQSGRADGKGNGRGHGAHGRASGAGHGHGGGSGGTGSSTGGDVSTAPHSSPYEQTPQGPPTTKPPHPAHPEHPATPSSPGHTAHGSQGKHLGNAQPPAG